MGNCLGQPNPGNELQRINPQTQHSLQGKQANKIYVAERQEISISEMQPTITKQSKGKQLKEKENKSIKCNAIQANKVTQVSQQVGNQDVKKLIADLIRKSKKGLIILRQFSSFQNNQDKPEPQELVSQQNTNSFPPNRLSFSYEVKAS